MEGLMRETELPLTTDPLTRDYVHRCQSAAEPLRSAVADADLPPALLASFGDRLLPRPLFAERTQMLRFAEDVTGLFHLITSLPERLYDGDLRRYCADLGLHGRAAALMCSLGGVAPPLYARADMYHDGTEFKLLEFNIASELGGVDRAGELPRALLEVDAFAAFARDHGLDFIDTGRQVARALRRAGRVVTGDREPVVALLEGRAGMARYGGAWRAFQELMRRQGLGDLLLGEVHEARLRSDGLYLRDRRVDVVVRCFAVDQILADPAGEAVVEPILRAHREGLAVLWTPMESNLFGNKACLAMLSDPRNRHAFSADELETVDRVLPWTRALYGDVPDEAMTDCLRRREQLILKPNYRYGGSGIVAGWETDAAGWLRALEDAADYGCVVQERVVPRAEPVVDPRTGDLGQWQAAWGLFLTPEGYAGAYARALPADTSAVIGISANSDTHTAGVFLY
ncbi:hypothetical protein [Micromonospora antibiotica]|uniref:Circularly permuted ATP-grasp type 2 n=1 Tax=Micromonospora antibiotica TaxID=2807623 RepID=A0ABS3V7A1_9ACTN|nr:hypothetical protein [Micromonospora antibiotica]MBO4161480.1 hypothetical protein [Micromonospora antibiotica]